MKPSASLAFLFAGRPLAPVAVIVLFSAVLLATPATAIADQITYTIKDYPLAETDENGYQDQVSGTITASAAGTLGSYTDGNIHEHNPGLVTLDYTITLQQTGNPNPNYPSITFSGSENLGSLLGSGTVTFTPDEIDLSGYLRFSTNGALLAWRNDIGSGNYYKGQYQDPNPPHPNLIYFDDTQPGDHLGGAPWVIATAVPEPATLTILASALLGFGVVYLRRRSAPSAHLLLFAVVLLASSTTAQAELFTSYTIVDYPQPDTQAGFTDHFTGTITIPVSKNNATYTTIPSDMSVYFEITGPGGTFTTTLNAPISPTSNPGMNFPYGGSLKFTPTSVILPAGSSLALYSKDNTNTQINFYWYNCYPSYPGYHSLTAENGNPTHPNFNRSDVGLPPAGSEMVIATVPEPATLTLLLTSALLGLGVVYLRRRKDIT
jgi:hypothetical protein